MRENPFWRINPPTILASIATRASAPPDFAIFSACFCLSLSRARITTGSVRAVLFPARSKALRSVRFQSLPCPRFSMLARTFSGAYVIIRRSVLCREFLFEVENSKFCNFYFCGLACLRNNFFTAHFCQSNARGYFFISFRKSGHHLFIRDLFAIRHNIASILLCCSERSKALCLCRILCLCGSFCICKTLRNGFFTFTQHLENSRVQEPHKRERKNGEVNDLYDNDLNVETKCVNERIHKLKDTLNKAI